MSATPPQHKAELVAHYEQLRSQVLGQSAGRQPGPGLAVLLGHGISAWMRAWSGCLPKREVETMPPLPSHPPCPLEVQVQMASLLAGIILSQVLEVTR